MRSRERSGRWPGNEASDRVWMLVGGVTEYGCWWYDRVWMLVGGVTGLYNISGHN